MASYEVLIKPSAARELGGVKSRKDLQKITDRIQTLGKEPRPPGCEKLSGREGYRIRQGWYRIIYEIDDQNRQVIIFKIGHRREVYR